MTQQFLARIATTALLAALFSPMYSAAQHAQYKLIDIGAPFGGPASYINPPDTFGSPNQINAQGIAVGGAFLPISPTATSNGFICFGPEGIEPFVNHALEWQQGVITDLGALGGTDSCSAATSINERGDIVGTSENGIVDPVLGLNEIRAVLWKNGVIQDLGTFGGNHSAASAINHRGQVVGMALTPKLDRFSYFALQFLGLSTGTQTQAFLWQNGHMQNLGTLGGPDAGAFLLNNRGQVAGQSYTNDVANATTGFPTLDPFLWENGRMIDLGSLGGTAGGPIAINNQGQVVGASNLAGDQVSDLFFWDHGKLTDLYTSTIGGNPITANAMNDRGEIVGGGAFPGRAFDAYVWKNGVATDLGTLDGDCYSEAAAIDANSRIVGQSFSCDLTNIRAFLWESGSIVDPNTLIPPNSSLQLVRPLTINGHGEIAGNGIVRGSGCVNASACGHAFVLIPIGQDEARGAVLETRAAPTYPRALTAVLGGLTAREVMARIDARNGRRSKIHGLAPARQPVL